MTSLVMVSAALPRWPRSVQQLWLDQDTRQHYLVVQVTSPWNDNAFTRVYATDRQGDIMSAIGAMDGRPQMVCGGWMALSEAVSDLTQRLVSGREFTVRQSDEMDEALIDADIEAFKRYITPTPQT
jgi:hypothetical protein